MSRWLPRVLGIAIAGLALVVACLVTMIRLDSFDEVVRAIWWDVGFGAVPAVAIALIRVPPAGQGKGRWHARTALAALVAWAVVSGLLAGCHYEQYRYRSSPPVLQQY
jgi:hypothetical protein